MAIGISVFDFELFIGVLWNFISYHVGFQLMFELRFIIIKLNIRTIIFENCLMEENIKMKYFAFSDTIRTMNGKSFLMCAMISAISAVLSASAPGKIEVMTWVPPYAISACQDAFLADFGACDAKDGLTRIGLQFWVPRPDGTIKYADHESYTPTDADVAWWQSWCTTNGIECLLCLYNNTGKWDWNLARSAFADNRATFVNALVSEMNRLGLDGIDIDLEGTGNLDGDRIAFDQFVHDLWLELSASGKILTIDTFHYIWNAPNQNWWSDWLGEVDNIHTMGYDDLYEGGTTWHKYSYQQDIGYAAGYAGDVVLMGMPSWLASWGASSGRGTSALAHVQEVRYDLTEPTGIAIWDLQLGEWQDSDLWCEIKALKEGAALEPPAAPSGLAAAAVSTSQINLTWMDNSSNEIGFVIERSMDRESFVIVDMPGANTTDYSDDDLIANTTYYYRVYAYNSAGDSGYSNTDNATTLTPPPYIDQVAISQIPDSGSVSGSYSDTHTNDGVAQSIQEQTTGGKPATRYSYLQFDWMFEVQPGETVTFYANIWSPPSSEGDQFALSYSTGGSSYITMFTVAGSSDSDSYQVFALPPSTSGTVYIRITDTDRSSGNRAKDAVYVDHLFIRSDNSGEGTIPAAPKSLTANTLSSSEIELTWNDMSDNELGFYVERSLYGLAWTLVTSTVTDSTSYIDSDLLPSTTYQYRVQAFNGVGTSDYSNIATAMTSGSTPTPSLHIADLDDSVTANAKNWDATVIILVEDNLGAPVADATVTGSWSSGGSSSGTTDSNGICSITRVRLKNNVLSTMFTVINVTHVNLPYNPDENYDPDGDSNGTNILILKPLMEQ